MVKILHYNRNYFYLFPFLFPPFSFTYLLSSSPSTSSIQYQKTSSYSPNAAPSEATSNLSSCPPHNSAVFSPYHYPYPYLYPYQSQPSPGDGSPQTLLYHYPRYMYPLPFQSSSLHDSEESVCGVTTDHLGEDDVMSSHFIKQKLSHIPYSGHHHSASYPSAFTGLTSHMGSLDSTQLLAIQHHASLDLANHQNYQIVPFGTPKKALKVLLLHGNLDIWVHEAKNLPNMDVFHKTMGDVLNRFSGKQTSDPYVSIAITSAVIGRTYVLTNSEHPIWNQHFSVPVAHHTAEVHFLVKDSDVVGSQLIGAVAIPVEHIYTGSKIEGLFPLINANGRPCKNGASLALTMQYIPMARLSLYNNGVG
ncbi:hypothetical protein M8C21_012410, partial [Ambrosia artemisiifolia]